MGSDAYKVMKKSNRHIDICAYAAAVTSLLMVSCGKHDVAGMFVSPTSPDERFAQSAELNKEIGSIEIMAADDEYGVCVFSDAHIDTDNQASITHLDSLSALCLNGWEKENAEESRGSKVTSGTANLIKSEPGQFTAVVCLGDMINGTGNWDCFEQHISPVCRALPFFTTAGNHELFFGQWKEYYKRFGSSSFTITVHTPKHRDLFIVLDSSSATLGKKQRDWLETTLQSATAIKNNDSGDYRHITVFTHTNFFKQSIKPDICSEYALEETYDLTDTFSRYGVKLVLTGHSHTQQEVFFRGTRYYTVEALEDGFCTILDIGGNIRILSHNFNL